MLFRVKSATSGANIARVQASGTLGDLVEAIRASTGIEEVRVSLNKKTELTGEGSLHDLGLRSGDLLYVLDGGVDAGQTSAAEQAGADPMLAEQPAPAAPAPRPVPPVAVAAAAAARAPPVASGAAAVAAAAVAADELPEGARMRFETVLPAANASSALEFVAAAVHALMLDAGFVPASALPSGLSQGWNGVPGLCALEYEHPSVARPLPDGTAAPAAHAAQPAVQLKLIAMGAGGVAPPLAVVVNSVVTCAEEPAVNTWQLSLAPHLPPAAALAQAGPASWRDSATLRSPAKFAREAGLRVVQPLLAQLRALSQRALLVDLCAELRYSLLHHLDARSLVAVGATCRGLRATAQDDQLWRRLVAEDFVVGVPATPPPGGWRRVYAEHVKQAAASRREMEARMRAEQEAARAMFLPHPARPHPTGPLGPFGGGPMPFPGMIGGDHDRLPGGLPGGLPIGGPRGDPFGGGGGGMPLGPLGDPDGRLPGGAVPPGSRFDPIHPDMDVDGGFGGAGGVPMPGRGMGRGRGLGRGMGGRGLHPDMPDPSRFGFGGGFGGGGGFFG